MIDRAAIHRAPKVLLHDHLDGGLRPSTVIELAREYGYGGLPTEDPVELARAFTAGADRKSLVLYLEGFAHTVGVMQTREALIRVAQECAEDLAADGVVYAEVRYAPELSTNGGLSLDEVTEAILEGFNRGSSAYGIRLGLIVTGMRQFARSVEVAELAIRHRDHGVVGFDVAGPEAGFPPTRYLDAFNLIHQANFHLTIHAGEAFGLP
ncbi:MAG: adenosine deaminase family protein, partial [Candidatus Limnocylindrales bacterium]